MQNGRFRHRARYLAVKVINLVSFPGPEMVSKLLDLTSRGKTSGKLNRIHLMVRRQFRRNNGLGEIWLREEQHWAGANTGGIEDYKGKRAGIVIGLEAVYGVTDGLCREQLFLLKLGGENNQNIND